MSSYLSPSAWNSFLRKLEAATEVEEQFLSNTLFLTFGTRIQVGQKLVEIQQQLGAGAFGVVYKVKDVETSSEYALKVVVCTNESDILDVENEILTLRKISHQNIISIIESGDYEDAEGSWHMLILTEYCSGGNLNDRLTRTSSENVSEEVSEELERKWILQIAEAVQFLHSINLVHRDLKPENVLLTANDDIKIGDFGLAREFISVKQTGTVQGTVSTYLTYKRYYMNTFAGTPHWMAPEVFPGPQGHGHYNEKADVFSLGILFLAILEREFIIDHEGNRYYGVFVDVDGEGKVGIGYAMYKFGSRVVADSLQPRGSNSLWMIALDALKFEQHDRPSTAEILNRITSFFSKNQICFPIPSSVCTQNLERRYWGLGEDFDPQMRGLGGDFDPQMQGLGGDFDPQMQGLGGDFDPWMWGVGGDFDPQMPGLGGDLNPQMLGLGGDFDPQMLGLGGDFNPQIRWFGRDFGPQMRELCGDLGPQMRELCGDLGPQMQGLCGDLGPQRRGLCGDLAPQRQGLCGDFGPQMWELCGDLGPQMRGLCGDLGPQRRGLCGDLGPQRRELCGDLGPQRRGLCGNLGPQMRRFGRDFSPQMQGLGRDLGPQRQGLCGDLGPQRQGLCGDLGPQMRRFGRDFSPQMQGLGRDFFRRPK